MSEAPDPSTLDDQALGEICAENIGMLGGVYADDIYLARQVEAAREHVIALFTDLTNPGRQPWLSRLLRRPAPPLPATAPEEIGRLRCRRMLPRYCLVAGEIFRLWQPLAPLQAVGRKEQAEPHPGLVRCRSLWKKMRRVAELMREGRADEAERDLGRVADALPALRKLAYDPTPDTFVGDAMLGHGGAAKVFEGHGLRCEGCLVAPRHKIADAATCHPFDQEQILKELRALVE